MPTEDGQIQPIAENENTISSINQPSLQDDVINNCGSNGPYILETDRESDSAQHESSLADMEVDSGSSIEMPP